MPDPHETDVLACPDCGESLDRPAGRCPHCGASVLQAEVAAAVDAQLATAGRPGHAAPRWAVLLTGLALGVAVAPLVAYAVSIATGGLSPLALAGLLLVGWLASAAALAGLPTPSAALSRGLYLVVAGVGCVLAALAYDALTAGPSAVSGTTGRVAALLAVPAVVAALLARRIASRAARQARGDPGAPHERGGVGPEESENGDERGDEREDGTDVS